MTIMFHKAAEAVQSRTTQTWEQIVSKTGTLRATENFLQIYAEYGGASTNKDVGIRVLVNRREGI